MIRIKTKGLMSSMAAASRMGAQVERGIQSAIAQGAHELRREMMEGLRNQAPGGNTILPLSPMTIALRRLPQKGAKSQTLKQGSTKALIRHGDLIRSINVEKNTPEDYTVGVHRGAKGKKSGKDMVNIAAIHEYGTKSYTQVVTPKMAAFSRYLVVMGILHVPWKIGQMLRKKIPARPFLRPAHKVWSTTANERFVTRLAQTQSLIIRAK